jgi:hypothetical protein
MEERMLQWGENEETNSTVRIERVNVLIIKITGREAFHQLLPANAALETAVGEEVEWFADVAETIIGTIGFDATNKGWNYAVLTRDAREEFQISEEHGNFPTRHVARIELWRRMAGSEAVEALRVAA